MLRKLVRVAGGLGVILPVVILGAWGIKYVFACLLALSAAGVALEYLHSTPSGVVRVRAETFSFDYRLNVLKLNRVSITEPSGKTLVTVRNLLLRDVIPGRRPIRAEGSDVVARVERLSNGRFQLEDLLPAEKQTSESKQPYSVDLRRVSVLYVDHSGGQEWRRWLSVSRLRLDGVGSAWSSYLPVKIQGAGTIMAHARGDGSELSFDFGTHSFNLAEVARHLSNTPEGRTVPELKDVSSTAATFDGRGYLAIKRESVRWQIDGSLRAANFRYGKDVSVAEMRATGLINPEGFRGTASGRSPGLRTTFDGAWRWGKHLAVSGNLVAGVDRPQSLPGILRQVLPRDTTFQTGEFIGWLSYEAPSRTRLVGSLSADSARFGTLQASHLVANIDSDDKRLVASNIHGITQSVNADAAISYQIDSGALLGYIRAPKLNIGNSLKKYGIIALDGVADIEALIFGSATKPAVAFRATGSGSSLQPGYEMRLGRFDAGGRFGNGRLDLDRFTLVGPSGSTSANGYWNVKNGKVSGNVLSTSVPLQAFFDEIGGSAAFSGSISGTAKALSARGQLEVFNAEVAGQQIPFARGDVEIDRQGLSATRVLAFKGGAQANGEGSIAFKTQAISGVFNVAGIDLSLYPPQGLTGIATITQGKIGGTLSSPNLQAQVEADKIVAQGLAVDHLTASTFIQNGILRVSDSRATVDSGIVTGSGTFDMKQRMGAFDLLVDRLPIRSLLGSRLSDVSVEGLLNGSLQGAFADSKLISLLGKTQIAGLKLNDAQIGNGEVSAESVDGNLWTGSVFLGDLNSYLQVPRMEYDLSKGTLDGNIISDNLQASVLYDAAKRYLVDSDGRQLLPEGVQEPLDSLNGNIDLDAHLSGPLQDVNFELTSLQLSNLVISGQSAGEMVASGSRKDRIWTIDQLEWTGGPGIFRVKNGQIDERGEVAIDGEVRNFRWSWLAAFGPDLASVAGRSDLSFLASGQTRSPEITASLSYEEGDVDSLMTLWPGTAIRVRNPNAKSRRVDLDSVVVKDGSIVGNGVFNVEGFTGSLEAKLPFRYPFEIPDNEPIQVTASIPERPLSSLAELLPWLDAKRTEGSFSAGVHLTGSKSDLAIGGQFDLTGKSIFAKSNISGLQDVSLLANFEKDKANISFKGNSSKGGSFETEDFGFSLQNLENIFNDSLENVLANRMFGTFRLNGFGIEYVDPKSGPMTATLSGALDVQGTLKQPEISGTVLLDSANVAAPTFDSKESVPLNLPFNPAFNVSVLTTNNLVLRAGTGKFELSGGGKLGGTLGLPVFTSALEVEKGSVRLPNARIVIEQGGTVLVTYRSAATGNAVSRVEVDLVGRTQVTAQSFTGIVERYDITLTIRGDLLAENGLQLTAQSDPSDLSSDRILAILGQRDVLASNPGENFRADRQLQSALLGLALPYFAGSVTEQLASKLGLDYLNIEYNTFDQFSVTAAITLGRDFVLSGRRQISSPLPGERLKYDVRLSYRPPFRSRALRRFTFSVGTDQDRPWKLSIEYGIRF